MPDGGYRQVVEPAYSRTRRSGVLCACAIFPLALFQHGNALCRISLAGAGCCSDSGYGRRTLDIERIAANARSGDTVGSQRDAESGCHTTSVLAAWQRRHPARACGRRCCRQRHGTVVLAASVSLQASPLFPSSHFSRRRNGASWRGICYSRGHGQWRGVCRARVYRQFRHPCRCRFVQCRLCCHGDLCVDSLYVDGDRVLSPPVGSQP